MPTITVLRLILGGAAVLAVLGFGVYVRHVIIENGEMKTELKTTKANLVKLQETQKIREEAITAEAAHELDRQKRKSGIEKDIADDKDGPVADVLRNAIGGLYGQRQAP